MNIPGVMLAIVLLAATSIARAGDVELPSVPASVLSDALAGVTGTLKNATGALADSIGAHRKAKPGGTRILKSNGAASGHPRATGADDPSPGAPAGAGTAPSVVDVTPGENEIVPIAVSHLNRIVTPFVHPRVHTASDATTQIEGPVIYVATADSGPVTLFITPEKSESPAISLTLVPRNIPPRQIGIRIRGRGRTSASIARAGRWERAQPYVDTLKRAFRVLAARRVPKGYGLRHARVGESIACAQPGIRASLGQVAEGHSLWLLVGVLRNTGARPVEIDEAACTAGPDTTVLAAAAWPRVWLAPKGRTEIYLAVRAPAAAPDAARRPSLLGTAEGAP